MIQIFFKTLPFFALIGLGYWACRTRFFTEEAAAYLTKFVFYFALSAMLFRFAASLPISEVFDTQFAYAYLAGCFTVYFLFTAVALFRGIGIEEAAIEAQCSVIGNVGFLGVPMLVVLLGEAAAGSVLLILAIDLIVFSSLIVILITGGRDGRMSFGMLRTVGLGLLKNPMIVSISLGLICSGLSLPIPAPVDEFLSILGAAATPGALFAIGASLAGKSAERLSVASWLSFGKLVLHPIAVAFFALMVFDVDQFSAYVMISAAALPVAGNVYILAQHYGVAPQRVSASILISTAISVLTVSLVIAVLQG
ncbi:AEC family transporter [Pseudohalocynthiibacter aestuariivivens]|jgi:malonate transporter and related proteins|uniref:AEC family transporter n=1 Tax=Pseudohalocynthiibacter aestuariivivens TaxID=1591409 RepID=A0ABV5JII5_9RHOB|nr:MULTISPECIES: AEC family transporter [Pseudohalocynthiibacter]MBS9715373.1 AEC family transporter [Pseudohalocynthiibacter aestuariivivens]MCK0102681.1 AEC family transporter [Pseudohalocynthiibacter sp. F2068]